jgi:hypothetical protein
MGGIHVGLNLEDHPRKPPLAGLHFALQRDARSRWRRQTDQRVKDFADAEVVDRRTEKYRCLRPGKEGGLIEFR